LPQFLFEGHRLDVGRRELRRGSEQVMLEPQVFDLIAYLLKNRERVLSKDDLIAAVWDGRIVSDSTLTSRINSARKAVGDSGEEQRLIRTYARKGIRFVGEVEETTERSSPEPETQGVSSPLAAPRGKPCVAVLPFDNLSSVPEQDYFSDGVTEDIITALSKHRSLLVVARQFDVRAQGTRRRRPPDRARPRR
jgi:DNA-binding winged helix-turn-helix (wHTH) protein